MDSDNSTPPPESGRRRAEISVTEIAVLAGVSVPTVSKVINGRPGVSAETRARIEELIREHGYRRAENPGSTPSVELVFQALDSLWALEIVRGVEEVVGPRGLAVAVTQMQGRLTPGRSWTRDVLARHPVGVIAVSARLTDAQYAQLASRAIPVVALDPTGEPSHQVPSVGAMNWNGGLLAARHLAELGHRRVAVVHGPDELFCCRARLDGFRAGMDAAGASVDDRLVRQAPLYVEGGLREGRHLLERPDPPTAVFATNDLQALGVCEAARQAGLRVPDDLSVVGFDDLLFTQWSVPALTTVRQPLSQMGAMAAETMLDLAAGRRPAQDRVELPTTLVVRQSSAPPRPDH
ncbi:LacI family DNA-binding transcriptional regulator [Peterkaempfera griseoplana]|uniref:LacI family DNA-binding transcriptional regulator n=1 Tax=Peterkaempfera griseoplana TaxID=66896 RepID=UPI0006E16552|nr:LacI family DNA-binding transcriptional regulator [Peterkaempfera griseoplana]